MFFLFFSKLFKKERCKQHIVRAINRVLFLSCTRAPPYTATWRGVSLLPEEGSMIQCFLCVNLLTREDVTIAKKQTVYFLLFAANVTCASLREGGGECASRKEPAQLTHQARNKPSASLSCTRAPPHLLANIPPSRRRASSQCPSS